MKIYRYRPYYHNDDTQCHCKCNHQSNHVIDELENDYMFFAPTYSENDINEGKPIFYCRGNYSLWKGLFKLFYRFVYLKYVDKFNNLDNVHEILNNNVPGFNDFLKVPYKSNFIDKLIKYLSKSDKIYFYELNAVFTSLHFITIDETHYRYYKKHKDPLATHYKSNVQEDWHRIGNEGLSDFERYHDKTSYLHNIKEKQYMKYSKYGNSYLLNQYMKIQAFNKSFFSFLEKLAIPNMGIISLSSRCNNDNMWANYANQYSGLCIEYKVHQPKHSCLSELIDKNGHPYTLNRVRYEKHFLTLNYFNSLDLNRYEGLTKIFGKIHSKKKCDHKSMCLRSILTKNKDWKGEKEYRLVKILDDPTSQKLNYSFKDVLSVILGSNLKLDDELRIIGIIQKKCSESNSSCCIYTIRRMQSGEIKRVKLMNVVPQN